MANLGITPEIKYRRRMAIIEASQRAVDNLMGILDNHIARKREIKAQTEAERAKMELWENKQAILQQNKLELEGYKAELERENIRLRARVTGEKEALGKQIKIKIPTVQEMVAEMKKTEIVPSEKDAQDYIKEHKSDFESRLFDKLNSYVGRDLDLDSQQQIRNLFDSLDKNYQVIDYQGIATGLSPKQQLIMNAFENLDPTNQIANRYMYNIGEFSSKQRYEEGLGKRAEELRKKLIEQGISDVSQIGTAIKKTGEKAKYFYEGTKSIAETTKSAIEKPFKYIGGKIPEKAEPYVSGIGHLAGATIGFPYYAPIMAKRGIGKSISGIKRMLSSDQEKYLKGLEKKAYQELTPTQLEELDIIGFKEGKISFEDYLRKHPELMDVKTLSQYFPVTAKSYVIE